MAALRGVVSLLLMASLIAMPVDARSPGHCDLDPLGLGCSGGGSGGGGGSSTTTTTILATYHWGSWGTYSTCRNGDPRYIRYLHWEDHSLVSPVELVGPPPVGAELGDSYVYQRVCVLLTVTSDTMWEELVEDIEALPEPITETSPAATGITGMETWLWFEGATQAGPVAVSWTDGTTGVTFDLEGVAWVGSITWDMGEGSTVRSDALNHSAGATVGGSSTDPAATHLYEQTSEDYGHAAGFPLTMNVTWVGEWRWRAAGGVWEPWRPMTHSLTISSTRSYPVVQVIGQLDPVG